METLKQISVTSTGILFALSNKGNVYINKGEEWDKIVLPAFDNPKTTKAKKVSGIDEIEEDINKELIFKLKNISPLNLEIEIDKAKQWMVDNPRKRGDTTLRTTRVLNFLRDYPDKKHEREI